MSHECHMTIMWPHNHQTRNILSRGTSFLPLSCEQKITFGLERNDLAWGSLRDLCCKTSSIKCIVPSLASSNGVSSVPSPLLAPPTVRLLLFGAGVLMHVDKICPPWKNAPLNESSKSENLYQQLEPLTNCGGFGRGGVREEEEEYPYDWFESGLTSGDTGGGGASPDASSTWREVLIAFIRSLLDDSRGVALSYA